MCITPDRRRLQAGQGEAHGADRALVPPFPGALVSPHRTSDPGWSGLSHAIALPASRESGEIYPKRQFTRGRASSVVCGPRRCAVFVRHGDVVLGQGGAVSG